MNRALKVAALMLAVACIWATPAKAQGCMVSAPFFNEFGERDALDCVDFEQVVLFGYAIGSTATTLPANWVCEEDGENTIALGCFDSVDRGDGRIQIDGNWGGNVPVTGCPLPFRTVYVVLDNVGGGFITSVEINNDFGGYNIRDAWRAATQSLACTDGGFPASRSVDVRGVSKTCDTTACSATIDAVAIAPKVFSDCDSDSVRAEERGPCTEGSLSVAAGGLYYKSGPCNDPNRAIPDLRVSQGGWTSFTGTATYPADSCLYLGATAVIAGVTSPGVTGVVQIAGNLATRPEIVDLRAQHQGRKVTVDFKTTSEVGLLSLAIFASDGRKVADVGLQGVGGAGATYSVATERSAYRGSKSLYVVGQTTEGQIRSGETRF
jgi:hypothetical protein